MGWVSMLLLVVRGAAQILMRERRARRRLVEREPVLLMGENVLDGAEAIGPQALGAQTGGFQPVRAVVPPEAHQAQTGAVALFGMRPIGEDAGDDAARRRAGLLGPGDQARRRPLGMGAMRAGHVVDLGRIPAAAGETKVDRHAAALEEDFDGATP